MPDYEFARDIAVVKEHIFSSLDSFYVVIKTNRETIAIYAVSIFWGAIVLFYVLKVIVARVDEFQTWRAARKACKQKTRR
jgi:hypothetical protein